MRSLRFLLPVVLMTLCTVALAQSDAQKSFDELKTLAGVWKGTVTANPPQPDWDNKPVWASLRVTSRGNAIVHEMKEPGTPDGMTHDDPITMFYLDGDQLVLTHYCDAGNRPRMQARNSDGKVVEFDFVDVSGSTKPGNMYHAVFTAIDANHHVEEWTYTMPGDKPMRARMELHRKNTDSAKVW